MAGRSSTERAPLERIRAALADESAWLVGGAVRDRLLGAEQPVDLDIVVAGDVASVARRVARGVGAHAFPLSSDYGAWRVVARDGRWHLDVNPLRGASIEGDLAQRDFTVNAIAQTLTGGELIDPLGGVADLGAHRLRLAGADALSADPLRALRLVRLACELALVPDADAAAAARRVAARLTDVAAERVYAELLRVLASERVVAGVRMIVDLSLAAAIMPELDELSGVTQSEFHHLDVLEHTLAVLGELVKLESDDDVLGPERRAQARALLDEPLADEASRRVGLRFGALLHDIAKPRTRAVLPNGRVGFPGHDELGASISRAVLTRLRAAEHMRAHVGGLARHHLRLGFLVDQAPLSRGDLFDYLTACGAVAPDVTLLSVADRLATRGERSSRRAIEAHVVLAREVFDEALHWHRAGRPAALVRGDELAAELGISRGPLVGSLLELLARAAFTGEVATRAEAVELARITLAREPHAPLRT
jgi:poly(A) polymerase